MHDPEVELRTFRGLGLLSEEERAYFLHGRDQYGEAISSARAENIEMAVRTRLETYSKDLRLVKSSGRYGYIYGDYLYPSLLNRLEKAYLKTGGCGEENPNPTDGYKEFLHNNIIKKWALLKAQIKMIESSPHLDWSKYKELMAREAGKSPSDILSPHDLYLNREARKSQESGVEDAE